MAPQGTPERPIRKRSRVATRVRRSAREAYRRRGRVHVASAIFYFSYPFNSSVKHPVSRMTSTRDQVCVLTGLMSYGSFRTYISPTPSLCKISKDPLIYTPSSWTHGSAATTDSTKLRIQSSRREKARSMSAPARSLYIGRPMLLNAVGGYGGRPNLVFLPWRWLHPFSVTPDCGRSRQIEFLGGIEGPLVAFRYSSSRFALWWLRGLWFGTSAISLSWSWV